MATNNQLQKQIEQLQEQNKVMARLLGLSPDPIAEDVTERGVAAPSRTAGSLVIDEDPFRREDLQIAFIDQLSQSPAHRLPADGERGGQLPLGHDRFALAQLPHLDLALEHFLQRVEHSGPGAAERLHSFPSQCLDQYTTNGHASVLLLEDVSSRFRGTPGRN